MVQRVARALSAAGHSPASASPLDSPLRIDVGPGRPHAWLKVDAVARLGESLVVSGWRHGPVRLWAAVDGARVECSETPVERADVARALGLDAAPPLGFVLGFDAAAGAEAELRWDGGCGEQRVSLPATAGLPGGMAASDSERAGKCPVARGALEHAAFSDRTRTLLVAGWALRLQDRECRMWLEDDAGRTYSMEGAVRVHRPEILEIHGEQAIQPGLAAGFLLAIPAAARPLRLKLKCLSASGCHLLAGIDCDELPENPCAASRWLFALPGDIGDFAGRLQRFDRPILEALIAADRARWSALACETVRHGETLKQPLVSVVVPLYGRLDLVEAQLAEFACDSWFRENAELVYVIDDPRLLAPFRREAPFWEEVFGVPFVSVWGGANRGFSGANNLGAAAASAEFLLFLNSDAFPCAPGWLQEMLATLEARPGTGAVAPRLLHADGSIQHAGMQFLRREELGVFVNHHPRAGLEPVFDSHAVPTEVDALTGACLLLRRSDLDSVGGWDTGYLIGDFEDSDLCLRLQARGLKCVYLPSVSLVHLERQSMAAVGAADYRLRVTLYNAVRHQLRWHKELERRCAASREQVDG